jgi:hypothetical protein
LSLNNSTFYHFQTISSSFVSQNSPHFHTVFFLKK